MNRQFLGEPAADTPPLCNLTHRCLGDGRVEQGSFNDFPIARIDESPK